MELCDAINKAIEDFGKEVLLDGRRLFNILNDWNAYESKALKRVTEVILNMGYGRHLYRLSENSESERQLKIKSYISDIVSEGLQRDIVCEVFDNFALAMYWEPVYSVKEEVPPTIQKPAPATEKSQTAPSTSTSSTSSFEEILKRITAMSGVTTSSPSPSTTSRVTKPKTTVSPTSKTVIPPKPYALLSDTLKETLKLAKEGKTIRGIARIKHVKVDTIEKHFVELIKNGFLIAKNYVNSSTYKAIADAYKSQGQPSSGELYWYFGQSYDSTDIKFVLADLERLAKNSAAKTKAATPAKQSSSPTPRTIYKLNVLKSSKELFDMDCTVDIASSGYYLTLNGKHIKLSDLCCSVSKSNPGQIWRMSPTVRGYEYRLVHYINGERYPFGEIKKTYGEIKFKPEVGKILTIPL